MLLPNNQSDSSDTFSVAWLCHWHLFCINLSHFNIESRIKHMLDGPSNWPDHTMQKITLKKEKKNAKTDTQNRSTELTAAVSLTRMENFHHSPQSWLDIWVQVGHICQGQITSSVPRAKSALWLCSAAPRWDSVCALVFVPSSPPPQGF